VYQGVSSLEESRILLRIAIYTTPWKRYSAVRAMNREIKLLFDREHINMPYDHLVVKEYRKEENLYTFIPEDEEPGTEDK
jgi:small conductance mechanosensitive channel